MTSKVRTAYSPEPNLAGVAGLLGDPVRAAMLLALFDTTPLPASELAYRGGASPQAASAHLRKLVDGGLLTTRAAGRQRLYRLASCEVARAIEALLSIAAPPRIVALRQSDAMRRLREARVCYDHLAGRLGVAVTGTLLSRGILRAHKAEFLLTPRGARFFEELGIDVAALRGRRRILARACMDWTERRSHLAGSLGMALCDRLVANGWIAPHGEDRSVRLTERGRQAMGRLFNMRESPAHYRSA